MLLLPLLPVVEDEDDFLLFDFDEFDEFDRLSLDGCEKCCTGDFCVDELDDDDGDDETDFVALTFALVDVGVLGFIFAPFFSFAYEFFSCLFRGLLTIKN